jgi:hypothetical protein
MEKVCFTMKEMTVLGHVHNVRGKGFLMREKISVSSVEVPTSFSLASWDFSEWDGHPQ